MPKIKPFYGIYPHARYAGSVVVHLEELSLDKAKTIRKQNPLSFVHMLVPEVANRYLMGSKKELAYKKISENFDDFIDQAVLIKPVQPRLYVYSVTHKGVTKNGIWAVTSIDDYLNNTIRKHELTRPAREQSLIDYLEHTGIDANPVLITYPPDQTINQLIHKTIKKQPLLDFTLDEQRHRLWAIADTGELNELVKAFAALPSTYIADGHHRAAAASLAGIQRRKSNLKHTGNEEYNFFNSVYIAADELEILPFNRLVSSLGGYSPAVFLAKIEADFDVSEKNTAVHPGKHQFGLYVGAKWYLLTARAHTYQQHKLADVLDVSILHRHIFDRILHITDSRTDAGITFASGATPVTELTDKVDGGEYAALFTLFPTAIDELMQVADAGEVMPPKSTWFEPKFLAGLVVHQIK